MGISSSVADVILTPSGLRPGHSGFSNLLLTLKAGEKIIGPYASPADARTGCGDGEHRSVHREDNFSLTTSEY